MELKLHRIAYRPDYIIGRLYVDGEYFCDTLEDELRRVKVMHETCIPAGRYRVILNYSNRFKRIMPLLVNVPGFDGIRIHNGRTDDHTSGCPLVGRNKLVGQLLESKETFEALLKMMEKAVENKQSIWIEIY